jgi:hypothetical protein
MKLDQTLLRAILAVGGLLTCGAGLVNAEDLSDVGIVRISDQPPGAAPCNNGNCQTGGCPSGQCNTSCPNGYCGNGNCGYGCGHGCGGCLPRCHCTGHVHRFLSWLDPLGGCTLPPDAGWDPPGKVPMWRRGVAYNKFFPDAWTGAPAVPAVPGVPRAPWVYMPTDTTQLGFYYQQVPYWQPVAGMIPSAPNPAEWHQPLFGDAGMAGSCPGNCPASAPAAAPAAEPQIPAPEAPLADLSSARSMPSLRPTPR